MDGTPCTEEGKGLMRLEDRLAAGLEALGLTVEPGLDTTAGKEYACYSFDTQEAMAGDDHTCLEFRQWDVFYVAPLGLDRREMRGKIRDLIQQLFGILPSEEDLTDNQFGQQYLYEFYTSGGVGIG